MIILTAAQANQVRGVSRKTSMAALNPILLLDGTYMLSEAVLADSNHAASTRAFLAALPTSKVSKSNIYDEDTATHTQTTTYVNAMTTVTWKSSGTSKV